MKHIEELVGNYLKLNTDYALFITGKWGIGKTYYYNNTLAPLIKNTEIKNCEENSISKFRPIYISLFGIKTIEDLQTQILLSIYKINGHKKKLAASIVSACARGATSFFNVNIETDGITSSILEVRGFEDLVLCFDDIERKDDNLGLKEFAGYISLLLENYSAKIILIANEDKITDKTSGVKYSKWKEVKEKIVGNTIEFNPALSLPVNGVINDIVTNTLYQTYLKDEENFILKTFYKTSQNLRTLKYALSCFQIIYETLCTELEQCQILKDHIKEILEDALYFTMIISEEYRLGKITYSDNMAIDNCWNFIITADFQQENNSIQVEDSYVKQFYEKYYSPTIPRFFQSIYDFITGGAIFEVKDMIKQLKKDYNVYDYSKPQQKIVLDILSRENCFRLSEKEYKEKTKEMIGYVENALYDEPEMYLSCFNFVMRFDNI